MLTINLDKNFQPFGGGIDFKITKFPSGCEPHIRLPVLTDEKALVTTRITHSDDIIILLLTCDALRRLMVKEIEIFIPYIPFARQDRVMMAGEPLSIKVFSDLINGVSPSKVMMFDCHSDVAPALINNAYNLNNHRFVSRVLREKSNFRIVSPDAGAYKKIFKLCSFLNYQYPIIQCNKVRNVQTGEIIEISCNESDLEGVDIFIVDDICDGGGTFYLLAKELRKRNCGHISLIVSHGIFSKGSFIEGIDRVYTTDSFKNLQPSKNLTILPINKTTL